MLNRFVTDVIEQMKSRIWLNWASPAKVAHERLVRVVCDYIAGMTDHYIQDVHKKLGAV
jgi:dGTP triphosphohydrolase